MTSTTTPTRHYADGARVVAITTNGPEVGTVLSGMVTGVRHPGWIYTVEVTGGRQVHVPTGLLTPSAFPAEPSAEADCRTFAAQYPTPNVLEAIRLCEAGRLSWTQVAGLFSRSLSAGIEAAR